VREAVAVKGLPLFSADGRQALTGDKNLTLWEVDGWQEVRTLAGIPPKGMPVGYVALSPDGKRGLSGSGDTLVLWDLVGGKPLRFFEPRPGKPYADTRGSDWRRQMTALAVDWQRRVAVTGDGKGAVRFWDLRSVKVLRSLQAYPTPKSPAFESLGVYSLALSQDGKLLFTTGPERESKVAVRVWDRAKGKLIRKAAQDKDDRGQYSRILLLKGDRHALLVRSKCLEMWDLVANRRLWQRTVAWPSKAGSAAVSRDGKSVMTGGSEIVLRSGRTGRVQRTLISHSNEQGLHRPCVIAFAPDGRRALTGTENSQLWLWDIARCRVARRLFGTGVPVAIHAIAISEDGKRALTGGDGQTVKVWDLERGKEIRTLPRDVLRSPAPVRSAKSRGK
jgi:WD40 repeat protein